MAGLKSCVAGALAPEAARHSANGDAGHVRHLLPWLPVAAGLAGLLTALAVSPVEVRVRLKAWNDNLLRPRIDVRLLWGLVHLRPRVRVPRHPLRDLAARLGGPASGLAGPKQGADGGHPQVDTGSQSGTARQAARGLQHATSGNPAGHYLFAVARAVAVRRLRAGLSLQTGDPARTAIAAGAAWAVLGAAIAALAAYVRFERPPVLAVRPLFTGRARIVADLDCILTARVGHVMVAALRSLLGGGTGRGDAG